MLVVVNRWIDVGLRNTDGLKMVELHIQVENCWTDVKTWIKAGWSQAIDWCLVSEKDGIMLVTNSSWVEK